MSNRPARGAKGIPSERKHSPAIKSPAKDATRSPVPTPATPTTKGLTAIEPKGLGAVSHDEIARAAYFRWLEKGGDPRANWLEAEAELRAKAALGMV